MRSFVLLSTFLFVLTGLSIQTVQAQERHQHPSSENAVSSLDVYSKWKGQSVDPNNAALTQQAVAAVTKRLDAQTATVDLTIAASDFLPYQGSNKLVVELQPFKYKIGPNGDFSRHSLGRQTQLDLPVVDQLKNTDDQVISNPTLTFFAPETANGVEIVVRLIGAQARSSITILMPLTAQAHGGAGGQVSNGRNLGRNDRGDNSGLSVTRVSFDSKRKRALEGACWTWTLTCDGCNKSWKCSNKDPEFNCITCTVSNCTSCEET